MIDTAGKLARELIRCPSVTPRDAGALGVLGRYLTAAGFTVDHVTFSAAGTPDIANLYARIGTTKPVLVFAGHTDVVPPGDEARWTSAPFSAETRDGALYGRGATDMKGGIAAFAAAASDFIRANPNFPGSIVFLITGDEEGPAINGTVKLLDWAASRGDRFSHCIVGEPTNPAAIGDMIKIGRRGSYSATLTAPGRQGHVAYPHLADNPVPRLMRLAGALLAPLDGGTDWFEPSNLEIVALSSGSGAFNVIPAEARLQLNIRFNDLWTLDSLDAELRRRLDGAAGGHPYTLHREPGGSNAFLTKPGSFTNQMAKAIARVTRREPALSTTGGTSDARFIKSYCPVIEFGLVGKTMHQIDEHVMLSDLGQLTEVYRTMIETYFRAPPAEA